MPPSAEWVTEWRIPVSKKIFRAIWMVSILVLTASLIIIMAALYDYVDTTQREQLVDETHLADKGV